MQRYSWILGVLGLCACSGSAIDVSPGAAGTAGDSVPAGLECTREMPLPTWPSPDTCARSSDLPLIGTWRGYVEQQVAPWDELTLVIEGASVGGGVCGTLTFGHGPALAPATDPTLSYPDPNSQQLHGGMPTAVVPGFPFTLLAGETDGTRLRFSVASGEVLRSWCALQTSYQVGGGVDCSCALDWAGSGSTIGNGTCRLQDPAGGHDLIVSCSQMWMCRDNPCACNAEGCDATPANTSTGFDLRITGDSAEGSDTSHGGLRTYFTRVP